MIYFNAKKNNSETSHGSRLAPLKKAALLFAVLMLFSLCSCGVGRVEKAGTEPQSTEETTSNIVRVTFPEGFTVADMAARLEKNGVCSAADFMNEVNNPEYLSEFGIEIDEPAGRSFLLEGYLFPDTYDFYRNENVSSVVKKFVRNFNALVTDEMRAKAKELGYTTDEIITIASIIQEEAGIVSEMSKVSSVLHNRLSSSSFPKLQCDACSFYLRNSVKPYVDEAKYEQLLQTYSTYNCYGLPEGPIANPGIDAVKAALNPEETDYYFFVTDDNGVYYYAETFEEHQENCSIAGIDT